MEQRVEPVKAAGFILLAMLVIGFIDNFVRHIAEDAGLWQFHATRGAMAIPAMILFGWGTKRQLWPTKLGGVVTRSLTISVAMVIYFGTLAFLPIEVAVAGLFTSPIFVLILSALFWGKKIGIWRWSAAGLGFVGLLLVIQPTPGALNATAFVPVIAGVFYALGNIATREWCEGESTLSLTLFSFGGLCVLGLIGLIALQVFPVAGSTEFVTRGYAPPTSQFLWLTLMQAVGSVIGVLCLVRGYQIGEASYVAIFEYALIVFASIWAWLLFGTAPNGVAILGIGLIITSGVVIAVRSK